MLIGKVCVCTWRSSNIYFAVFAICSSSIAQPFGVYSLQQLGNNLVPHVPVSTDASSHGGLGVGVLMN